MLLSEKWNRKKFPIGNDDESTIRACLKMLKNRAAELVAPLLVSGLKFEGKDKQPYLTAVQVGDEDVP